ncbi:hypothetical protein [Nannocystis bainbridge]|uniref:DUF2383 domain-containing protein n=1 Tax=Nannocystis bainbridge TaxID=2995303 RepID=A0ABT5EB51_9BACT|nr:hypothetical protein [Nannocystis bainbridge]MDC0722148.1 hypothetical protein [Nannocystis bainbridge]
MRPTIAASPLSMTPDELAETRRKAGFQDGATLEAERAEARERVARSYVRAHLPAYREVVKALRGNLAEIERAARRWLRTSDPQRAYERWRGVSRRRADRVAGLYAQVADDGFDGGHAQRLLADAYRRWEELREDLGGEVAADARFSALLVELRDALTAVARVLDEIEHDEELAAGP